MSFQPVAFSAASTGAASGASIDGGGAALGVVQQHAVIVLQAGEQMGFGGHGLILVDSGSVNRSMRMNCLARRRVPRCGAICHRFHDSFRPCRSTSSICAISTASAWAWWRAASSAAASARCGATPRGQRVLGVGYATPYLGLFREEAERCLAFMPAAQGVVKWPTTRPALSALVDENELPLPDAAVDRVLLVHALEMTHDPAALLREVWRVLASGGRLLAVVPNRRGLWARMDTTPFGHGRPYSRSQINQLLRETWFTPTGWSEALYVPPIARGWFLRSAVAWERTGATLSAPFAGVHIVEATKQVYRAIPARREKRRLVPALEPALAPSPGGADDSRDRIIPGCAVVAAAVAAAGCGARLAAALPR